MSEPVVLNAIILFVGVPAPILILCPVCLVEKAAEERRYRRAECR